MGLDVPHDPALLGSEFAGLTVEEVVVDTPVQLVDVHAVDAVLKTLVLALDLAIASSWNFFSSRVALAEAVVTQSSTSSLNEIP